MMQNMTGTRILKMRNSERKKREKNMKPFLIQDFLSIRIEVDKRYFGSHQLELEYVVSDSDGSEGSEAQPELPTETLEDFVEKGLFTHQNSLVSMFLPSSLGAKIPSCSNPRLECEQHLASQNKLPACHPTYEKQ